MKKSLSLIVFVLFSFAFLFIGSCENNTPITSSNQQSLESIDQQLDELEKNVAGLNISISDSVNTSLSNTMDGTRAYHCCNNSFPGTDIDTSSLDECFNGDPEIVLTGFNCAKLWAAYNHSYPGGLGAKACGQPIPVTNVPNITGLTKSQSGNNPYFNWNFMYCHCASSK